MRVVVVSGWACRDTQAEQVEGGSLGSTADILRGAMTAGEVLENELQQR